MFLKYHVEISRHEKKEGLFLFLFYFLWKEHFTYKNKENSIISGAITLICNHFLAHFDR